MAQTTFPLQSTVVCRCRFASAAPAHHDQLMRAEADLGMAVELLELATTWDELDYSLVAVIPPQEWLLFAGEHRWHDPELVERLFSVAVDVALRRAACTRPGLAH